MNEEYIKDYEGWNKKKQDLDKRVLPDDFFYLEREIWWASIGINIGKESDGKNEDYERPVLVLRAIDWDTLWILPITSTESNGQYFESIQLENKAGTIMLHQIRYISANRMSRFIKRLDEDKFIIIVNKIIKLLHKQEIPV